MRTIRAAAVLTTALAWFVTTLAGASPALAHGFGQRYDLPVPLWLYLYGSAGAVLLSFVVFGLFVGGGEAGHGYPRLNLLRFGPFRATLAGPVFVSGVRVLSVALFALVILAGLVGNQTAVLNLAPTVVWVIWWVGFGLFVALVGNLWALVNPLKVVFEWADGLAAASGWTSAWTATPPTRYVGTSGRPWRSSPPLSGSSSCSRAPRRRATSRS